MKWTSGFFALLFACMLVPASISFGALVTFELIADQNTGTFELTAQASLGDNFGVASYGVPLYGGILNVDHNSPVATFTDVTLPAGPFTPVGGVGFDLLRTADGNLFVSASQDTVLPNPLGMVYGIGQTSGDLNAYAPPPVGTFVSAGGEQLVYGVPVVLAVGTWDAGDIGIDTGSVDLGANVFLDDAGSATEAAQIEAIVTIIPIVPEPGTMALVFLGMIGILSCRRLS